MNSETTFLTLPPHLIDEISRLVQADIEDLPQSVKEPLVKALQDVATCSLQAPPAQPSLTSEDEDILPVAESRPPTVDIEVLEELGKWAGSKKGQSQLKRKRLDPNRYLLISLLAGTEVWIPQTQRILLAATERDPDNPSPYLPSHLSNASNPDLSPLKSLNKQITTILNILFSIFGSGFAVFVASVTGAGYSREKGVILGILAGVVVGIAEGVLFWIFVDKLQKGRAGEGMKRIEGSRGSGALQEEVESKTVALEGEVKGKRTMRMKRRAIGEALGDGLMPLGSKGESDSIGGTDDASTQSSSEPAPDTLRQTDGERSLPTLRKRTVRESNDE